MARQLVWYEKSGGFAAQADQMAAEIISTSDMADIGRGTIERIILDVYFKNGSTAQNDVAWGLLVTDARVAATDYPDVRDDDNAALGWLQKQTAYFDTAD